MPGTGGFEESGYQNKGGKNKYYEASHDGGFFTGSKSSKQYGGQKDQAADRNYKQYDNKPDIDEPNSHDVSHKKRQGNANYKAYDDQKNTGYSSSTNNWPQSHISGDNSHSVYEQILYYSSDSHDNYQSGFENDKEFSQTGRKDAGKHPYVQSKGYSKTSDYKDNQDGGHGYTAHYQQNDRPQIKSQDYNIDHGYAKTGHKQQGGSKYHHASQGYHELGNSHPDSYKKADYLAKGGYSYSDYQQQGSQSQKHEGRDSKQSKKGGIEHQQEQSGTFYKKHQQDKQSHLPEGNYQHSAHIYNDSHVAANNSRHDQNKHKYMADQNAGGYDNFEQNKLLDPRILDDSSPEKPSKEMKAIFTPGYNPSHNSQHSSTFPKASITAQTAGGAVSQKNANTNNFSNNQINQTIYIQTPGGQQQVPVKQQEQVKEIHAAGQPQVGQVAINANLIAYQQQQAALAYQQQMYAYQQYYQMMMIQQQQQQAAAYMN